MVFGKRKRDTNETFDPEDNFRYDYDYYQQSGDEDAEEVEILDVENTGDDQEKTGDGHAHIPPHANQKRLDPKSRPLLDEVNLKGAAVGKNPGGAKNWECKYCKGNFVSSYSRIHTHFFGAAVGKKAEIKRCPALLQNHSELERIRKKVEDTEKQGVSASLKSSTLTRRRPPKGKNPLEESFALMDRKAVDAEVVNALCVNGIPFNVLRNPQFCRMIKVVNMAPKGYKAPPFDKARTTILDEVKTNVEKELIPVKNTWYIDGASIVSDGWTNVKNSPLINVLAVNSRGAMFLYAEDFSGIEKIGVNIAELLLKAIEEVGPFNVVQVVTDNAANCKAAGREVEKVHPHIFWSPCVVHTLNLIFKDLARDFPWFRDTYLKGKSIVKYFKNHEKALTIFRSNSKLELLKVAKTRFASHYIMLRRLVVVREALATTVVVSSWKELIKSGDENMRAMAVLVTGYIGSDDFWDEVHNILRITKPIYTLIRICDRDGPLMGEIYEGMDNMLGEIKDVSRRHKYGDAYPEIEAIVLNRWEKMNVPMHCIGFALSPRFYDNAYVNAPAPGGTTRKRPNEDKEVVHGVLKAFEKIASCPQEAGLLRKQFADFHMRRGLFGTAAACVDASTMDAIDWWATYGAETPELAEVARKILAQPITTSSAERNWSTYSYIHNVKRNRLNASRADKLVFIHSNTRLLSRLEDSYKEGPYKKWDIDPEDTIIDDSQVRLEELRWKFLEDDGDADAQHQSQPEDITHSDQAPPGFVPHAAPSGSRVHGQRSALNVSSSNPAASPVGSSNAVARGRTQQSQIYTFVRRGSGGSSSSKDKGKNPA